MEITFRECLAKEISAWPRNLPVLQPWGRAPRLRRRSAHTRVQGSLRTLPVLQVHASRPLFFSSSFFPALPLETVLPGSLDDDDDIPIHFVFGRALFQMIFFAVRSPTEQVLRVQKWPRASQMRCLPTPQHRQARAELKSQLFTDIFPPFSFSFL